jgi:hypothetical protein
MAPKFESNLAKSLGNQVESMPRRLEDIIRGVRPYQVPPEMQYTK